MGPGRGTGGGKVVGIQKVVGIPLCVFCRKILPLLYYLPKYEKLQEFLCVFSVEKRYLHCTMCPSMKSRRNSSMHSLQGSVTSTMYPCMKSCRNSPVCFLQGNVTFTLLPTLYTHVVKGTVFDNLQDYLCELKLHSVGMRPHAYTVKFSVHTDSPTSCQKLSPAPHRCTGQVVK